MPDDVSLVKVLLINVTCDKHCTETGEQDLCGVWVHAVCDKDHYQETLTSNIENLAYLCKLNSCQEWFKQMIFETAKADDDSGKLSSRIEAKLQYARSWLKAWQSQ